MYRSGLYTGVVFEKFQVTDSSGNPVMGSGTVGSYSGILGADAFLNDIVGRNAKDSVVSITMFPHFMDDSIFPQMPATILYTARRPSVLDGYTPRNNKLLTYPYTFLCIDTLNEAQNYRYERGASGFDLNFSIYGVLSPIPEIIVAPQAYNGVSPVLLDGEKNATESVSCTGFPQVPFLVDSYLAWLAQKSVAQGIGIVSSLFAAVAGVISGNPIAVGGGFLGAAATLNNAAIESTKGSMARGGGGESGQVGAKLKGIYAKQMCLQYDYARAIDNFFDRYGYAADVIKVPARHNRACWTYTKTRDSSIHGNLPAEAIVALKNIYNNGVTFWDKNSNIGDYTQTNSVLSTP